MRLLSSCLAALPLLVGCAAALPPPPPQAPEPPPPPAAPVVEEPAAPAKDEPPVASCTPEGDEGCFPDDTYRAWLCERTDPAAAVALFHKGTPWVRAYVARDLESWDPAHRTRSGKSHLSLDEEVIVLHAYKPTAGVMVVGQANGFGWTSVDAVRADGSCVSLMSDEISNKRPPAPKHAPIAWDRLDEHTKSALLASPDVRKKADLMTRACATKADSRCTKAKSQLTDAVVANTN